MKKSWELISKILSGEKTIESRWYKNKAAPWDKIKRGDTIFFKNSGEAVIAKANVARVLQFENLTPKTIKEIYAHHGVAIGVPKDKHAKWVKDKVDTGKRYCILAFLSDPRRVEPFAIDKTGFGSAAAWLCVEDIEKIKV